VFQAGDILHKPLLLCNLLDNGTRRIRRLFLEDMMDIVRRDTGDYSVNDPMSLQTGEEVYSVRSKVPAHGGALPYTEELLLNSPSGDLFGFSQDAGMGWDPELLAGDHVLLLSTQGGLRKDDGTPLALGYHTGHWELGLLTRRAAETFKGLGCLPFAAYCSDPCDGRTQGTAGMMDSLPYRNTAAEVFGRLIRSMPPAKGVMGIATCDKGLPAMMMALAAMHELPGILVPGGVTLPPHEGEDAGTIQSIGTRFAHGEVTLKEAAELGCAACATSGGGCQFLGTAASSQVVAEALGMAMTHAALAPSGEPVWLSLAAQSSLALKDMMTKGLRMKDILTQGSIENAMVLNAAFGGSTNMLLHIPAIAFEAGLARPSIDDWTRINATVPRLVDVLPNGPQQFKTVQVFLAGGVPEVMLHLRDLGLLHLDCMTVTGQTLGENLHWWEQSDRRKRFQQALLEQDGVTVDQVIMTPAQAKSRGLTRTVVFPQGNLGPEGAVVKSAAISDELYVDDVYHHCGPARVFTSERAAIAAVKSTGADRLLHGEVMVLLCKGPLGAGMPETAQITIALKYTKSLKHIALITDGRFSGFSSGPCIGHVGPEAMAGGPLGKVTDGDLIEIRIDRQSMTGALNLVGDDTMPDTEYSAEAGSRILAARALRNDLAPDPGMPESVRLWGLLQQTGGGTWGGCVTDVDVVAKRLNG
jgi:putative YjhG/YagF family dehydratase